MGCLSGCRPGVKLGTMLIVMDKTLQIPSDVDDQNGLDTERLLGGLRTKTLGIILLVAMLFQGLIVLRILLLQDFFPWSDLITLILAGTSYAALRAKPDSQREISWLFMLVLYGNIAEALFPWSATAITPTHLFLPLLVLYGTILGDHWMSVVSAVVALGIYGATAYHYSPLSQRDIANLTNLVLLTVGSALVSFAVWRHYALMIRRIRSTNHQLAQELNKNQHLQSILLHDLANPLTALQGTIGVMSTEPGAPEGLSLLERMTDRMFAILGFVRLLTRKDDEGIVLGPVNLTPLLEGLRETFMERIQAKQIQLEINVPQDFRVHAHADILAHTILANLLSNAIKFSPKGASVRIQAHSRDGRAHISVSNHGMAIPTEVIQGLETGSAYTSLPGTDGESGLGYGLRIVSKTLHQIQGRLSIEHDHEGPRMIVDLPLAED